MKKFLSAILVAMATMVTMAFAQIGGLFDNYFTITNKTTGEVKKVSADKFTSLGNDKFTYDVDFCLGVYEGDEIEVSYTKLLLETTPQAKWYYSWGESSWGSGSFLENGLKANLKVDPQQKKLNITCNYL
ncbi:MAG: hypothetical protein K2O37_05750, partial [Bacteroidales bacterium]|nr:hypothetical protein [Bacteroidales bacterium]